MERGKKKQIASLTLVFRPEYGRLGRTYAGDFHHGDLARRPCSRRFLTARGRLVEVGFSDDALAVGALSQRGRERSSSFHSTFGRITRFEHTEKVLASSSRRSGGDPTMSVEPGSSSRSRRPSESIRWAAIENVARA